MKKRSIACSQELATQLRRQVRSRLERASALASASQSICLSTACTTSTGGRVRDGLCVRSARSQEEGGSEAVHQRGLLFEGGLCLRSL